MAPLRTVRTVTDPAVLAALAHATRRRLMDVLKTTDAATVSTLAERTGVAVGSASHHLKVLAQAGLVEEVEEHSPDRRERWWRLVDVAIRWRGTDFDDSPATEAIVAAATSLGLERQVDLARRSLAADPDAPHARAAFSTDAWLRLTAVELDDLAAELQQVITRFRERAVPDAGNDARAQVFVFARGFPAMP
ncbi:helix-turn-helix domain-containing protein [soil metagenome]